MKFGPIPLDQAEGKILGHNVAGRDGRRALRKGSAITADDIKLLRELGRAVVYVADLEVGDIGEDEAADRISRIAAGEGLRRSKARTGRVNFLAGAQGVLRVDRPALDRLNSYEGITLATRRSNFPVEAGKITATLKIIPYALPEFTVAEIERTAPKPPLMRIEPLRARKVGLIFSSSPEAQDRVRNTFEGPLRGRIKDLGSQVEVVACVALEDEAGEAALADLLAGMVSDRIEMIILAGETAIMDRNDIAPRAVDRAGGRVECVGVPVDPGNLLMIAYLGQVPILGAPGCARSRKVNVIDWVLPRLLVGEALSKEHLIEMGDGGLLEDTLLRPNPRTPSDG
ncbi:MAG: molybdopterin-binding protein [Anaerolineales bacterium]|nr:molybdopterin-binding protein [Anaerolineales bacterium]